MNILSISGVLPIPGIRIENDFLIPLYDSYKKLYANDNISFILPNKSNPLNRESVKVIKHRYYSLNDFTVNIIPYLSTWRFQNLHSILAYSSFFLNKRFLKKYLKQNKIDIIHAEYIIPDGVLAYLIYKKFNIPFLLTTHKEERYFKSFISRNIAIKILRNAKYLTPLNFISDKLYRSFGIEDTLVVPHGIDEIFFKHSCIYNEKDSVNILSIARLLDWKNIDKVLLALNQIFTNTHQNFTYTIVGVGPEKEKLLSLGSKLAISKHVRFIDRIEYENIPREMSKYDIFILPSYFETFGRVFFEAMAIGLPIICAKNTGIHGYFVEFEEGISVNHTDINDIADKLKMLIENSDLRKKIGIKGKKLVQKYTWEKTAVIFHELYTSTLNL